MQLTIPRQLPQTSTNSLQNSGIDSWTKVSLYDQTAEEDFYQRMDSLRAMEANWDLDGAAAPNDSVIDDVVKFCRRSVSPPIPFARPLYSGGIQLEWFVNSRRLEIDFEPNQAPSYFTFDSVTGDEKEGQLPCLPCSGSVAACNDFESHIGNLISWVKGE